MRFNLRWLLLPALALIIGCPERSERYDGALNLAGPFVKGDRAVYLSGGREAVLILEPGAGQFQVVRLVGQPLLAVDVPTTSQMAVLVPSAEALQLVDAADGGVVSYDLSSGFDSVAISEDGGYALASFAGGASGVLSNAAEVAVVDLNASPSASNPTKRTIASAGGAPIGIAVSPPFGPNGRRLAIVRSVNHLAAIDLTKPTGATRSIPLVSPGSGATVTPQEVLFAPHGDRLEVFVRVSGLNDIYHLRFDGAADTDGAPLPVLNQFAVGQGPAALAVWTDPDGELRLLTVNAQSRDLTVVDVESAQTTTIPLGSAVSDLFLYDGLTGREALVFSEGGSTTFHRVALEDLATKKSKAVASTTLVAPIDRIEPVALGQWFLVSHPGAGAAVTLIEGAGKRIMPFTSPGSIVGTAVSDDGQSIFLLVKNGSKAQLSVVDVPTGHPETMELDIRPTGLYRLGESGFLVVTHSASGGGLTLVDGAEIEDGISRQITGFGLSGLLDEEGVEK